MSPHLNEYSDGVRVEVLGALRVTDSSGADVTRVGWTERRLFALLGLRGGHVASVDATIDALSPNARPADPVAALQNHMPRVRRALPDGPVESVGDGCRPDGSQLYGDADRLG